MKGGVDGTAGSWFWSRPEAELECLPRPSHCHLDPQRSGPRSAGALILDVKLAWNWSRESRERIFKMKLEAFAKRKAVEGRESARHCRF